MDRQSGEWRAGWPVTLAGLIGVFILTQHFGALGVLMKPLTETFGWSRAQISAGIMITAVVQCILIPLLGPIMNRIPLRRFALGGALVYAAGLLAIAACSSNILTWYFGWAILGLGIVGISPVVWTMAVTRAFDRARGTALAVALSGTGVSTLALPLLCAWIYEAHGWRASVVALAVLELVILLPALVLLMRHPAFGVDATQKPTTQEPIAAAPTTALLRDRSLYLFILTAFLMAAAVGAMSTHMQAILQDQGATPLAAAAYYSVAGPALIVGRLGSGFLLDRLPTKLVATILFAIPAATATLLLSYDGSPAMGVLICLLLGLGYGAETDLFAYLCARYFRGADYPLAYSLTYSAYSISYGLAGVAGGAVFDRTGTYHLLLIGLIGGVVVAIALLQALGHRDRPEPVPAPDVTI